MRVFLAWFILAATLCGAPKRLELAFPQLAERIQVVFPENYDPQRKWPAVFYYHGTGGKPTTELIRAHTGDQDWFVVGMTYTQKGKIPATPEYIAKEFQILTSARHHLATRWNVDRSRCYVAGFSKGGWMSGFLLQHDPGIAGAIILGAGHNFLVKKPARFRSPKPLFIGIGREDGNYPFALRAVVHYRPLGARTTLDTWRGLGHSVPQAGSQALRQWLTIEANPGNDHRTAAGMWLENEIDKLKGLPDLVDQWRALRDLENTPYAGLLGEDGKPRIRQHLAKLEKGARVAAEAAALAEHRLVIRKEMKGHTLELCQRLAGEYLQLSEKHNGTKQADVALADHERLNKLVLYFKGRREVSPEKGKEDDFPPPDGETVDPFPRSPQRNPVLPRNPLIP